MFQNQNDQTSPKCIQGFASLRVEAKKKTHNNPI